MNIADIAGPLLPETVTKLTVSYNRTSPFVQLFEERGRTMLKPYVSANVHYIPGKRGDADFDGCGDPPYAATITKVRLDLDVDLVVFTTMRHPPIVSRMVIPHALKAAEGTPHWEWIDTRGLEGVADLEVESLSALTPEVVEAGHVHPGQAEKEEEKTVLGKIAEDTPTLVSGLPLQDVLRSLIPGRGDRDRLLLERWALALEEHRIDDTVLVKPAAVGQYDAPQEQLDEEEDSSKTTRPAVFDELGASDSKTTRAGEQA